MHITDWSLTHITDLQQRQKTPGDADSARSAEVWIASHSSELPLAAEGPNILQMSLCHLFLALSLGLLLRSSLASRVPGVVDGSPRLYSCRFPGLAARAHWGGWNRLPAGCHSRSEGRRDLNAAAVPVLGERLAAMHSTVHCFEHHRG